MAVVRFEKQEKVGHIVLDRPPANSYDKSFLDDLSDAIDEARFDASVGAVVVRSASPKFFSAGADVKMFTETDAVFQSTFVIHANEIFGKLERTAKIVIAAINGHCMGGGLEIALCCDFRYAAEGTYQIGLSEARLGMLPGTGGTQRLPRLIGRSRALDLMIHGTTMPPADAKAAGIVDELVPADKLLETVQAYAAQIAGGPTLAIGKIKLAAVIGGGMPFANGLAYEHEAMSRVFASEDAREGMRSFAEKRPPEYKGR